MKTDEFLEAMGKLLSERFVHCNGSVKPSVVDGEYLLDIRILDGGTWGTSWFLLYNNYIINIDGSSEAWKFDIADPKFNPEDIIKWISDRLNKWK